MTIHVLLRWRTVFVNEDCGCGTNIIGLHDTAFFYKGVSQSVCVRWTLRLVMRDRLMGRFCWNVERVVMSKVWLISSAGFVARDAVEAKEERALDVNGVMTMT